MQEKIYFSPCIFLFVFVYLCVLSFSVKLIKNEKQCIKEYVKTHMLDCPCRHDSILRPPPIMQLSQHYLSPPTWNSPGNGTLPILTISVESSAPYTPENTNATALFQFSLHYCFCNIQQHDHSPYVNQRIYYSVCQSLYLKGLQDAKNFGNSLLYN